MKTALSVLLAIILYVSTAYAADIPKLITNFGKFKTERLAQVEETPLAQNVYDLSFVAYDKAFAEEFGLVEDNITEMDEHLRFMEIRMVTEGKKTNCYYNLIIDKSVDIDFPEENFYHQGFTPELNLPVKQPVVPETFRHFAELRAGRKIMVDQRFNNRTYIANRGYKFHSKGNPFSGGGYGGAIILFYIQDRPVPFHVLSTEGSCENAPYDFPEASFWIRKKGRQETMHPKMEDYHTFTIPKAIVNQIYPYFKAYTAIKREQTIKRLNQQ